MKFLDLFAGIGGFRLGMEQAGHECVGYVEWDKYARKSYEAIHDTEGEWTAHDITSVSDEELGQLKTQGIETICGGFPCQSFSVAGKRGGFSDTRGTLFFEVARFAEIIKPKYLFLENVKGLIGHDEGKTLDTIVKTLNDIGYHVDFDVMNSKYFGVPQNRERIFIMAVRDDVAEAAKWIIKGTNVVSKGKKRIADYEGVKTIRFEWPEQLDVSKRLKDVIETGVDEKYYLSDEKTAKLIDRLHERDDLGEAFFVKGDLIDRQNPRGQYGFDREKSFTLRCAQVHGVAEPIIAGSLEHYGNDQMNRVYHTHGIAPTITVVSGGGREQKIAEEVRGCSTRTRAYAGQPERLEVRSDLVSNTVTTVTKDSMVFEAPRYRIRKLTPLECFRLQGYSDWMHNEAAEVNSNSQLYKQAGNSVTVNVIHEIAKRL